MGGLYQLAIAGRHVAYDCTGVRAPPFKLNERGSRGDDVAGLSMQGGYRAREWRGDFNYRFRRLHSQHGLVDRHHVTDVDVPTDDFRLGETFAEIREIENPHLRSVRRRPCGII